MNGKKEDLYFRNGKGLAEAIFQDGEIRNHLCKYLSSVIVILEGQDTTTALTYGSDGRLFVKNERLKDQKEEEWKKRVQELFESAYYGPAKPGQLAIARPGSEVKMEEPKCTGVPAKEEAKRIEKIFQEFQGVFNEPSHVKAASVGYAIPGSEEKPTESVFKTVPWDEAFKAALKGKPVPDHYLYDPPTNMSLENIAERTISCGYGGFVFNGTVVHREPDDTKETLVKKYLKMVQEEAKKEYPKKPSIEFDSWEHKRDYLQLLIGARAITKNELRELLNLPIVNGFHETVGD